MSKEPQGYPYIEWWGLTMGSHRYYIQDQKVRAAAAKAPQTAIYEKSDSRGRTGEWATIDGITNPVTLRQLREFQRKEGLAES